MKDRTILYLILMIVISLAFIAWYGVDSLWRWQEAQREFQQVIGRQAKISDTLREIHPAISQFDKKNDIVEMLLRFYVNRLPSRWEDLRFDDAPFFSHLSVLVAINGRLRGRFGRNVDSILPERSLKFLMEAQHKAQRVDPKDLDVQFNDLMQRESPAIFGYPIPMSAYSDMMNRFHVIFSLMQKRHVYAYFHMQGDIQIYFFLPADLVKLPELKTEVHNWLIRANPHLHLRLQGDELKMSYVNPTLKEFFLRHQEEFLGLMLAALFLCIPGGVRFYLSHFETQFWLMMALFLITAGGLGTLLFKGAEAMLEVIETQSARQKTEGAMVSFNQRYRHYRNTLYQTFQRDFENQTPFKTLTQYPYFRAISINKDGAQMTHPRRDNHFAHNVVLIAATVFLSSLSENPFRHNKPTFVEEVHAIDLDQRLLPQGIEGYPDRKSFRETRNNLMDSTLDWNEESVEAMAENLRIMFSKSGRARQVLPLQIGMQILWLFTYFDNSQSDFRCMVAGVMDGELLRGYLQANSGLLSDDIRLSAKIDGDTNMSPMGFHPLESNEYMRLFDTYGSEPGQIFTHELDGELRFGTFSRDSTLPGWTFLVSFPTTKLVEVLSELALHNQVASGTFIVALLIFGLILCRRILHPLVLLEGGFFRVENSDLEQDLPVQGQHEGSQVLVQFNRMLAELRMKKKMAPFVSEAVTHLFTRLQKGERKLEGRGCMLFSDIRSFTSISEQYDPEEIVSMLNDYFSLWQPIVEREKGIIIRFIGDAVVAIFLEELNPDFAASSVRAGHDLMVALKDLNDSRHKQGLFTVQNGIGISQSNLLLTVIGDEEKAEFLILGHANEVSEVLEAESKAGVATKIIVDEQTRHACPVRWEFLPFSSSEFPQDKVYELKSLGW